MSPHPPVGRKKRASDATLGERLRESFAHTPRTLALVYKSSPAATVALGALTLLLSFLPLLVAYAGKEIVDAVVARSNAATLRWVLIELGVIGVQALAQRGLALLRTVLGARLSLDINGAILEKAINLELRHFEDSEFYDRLTRARREASSRPLSVVTEGFQLIQNTLTLVGYGALLVRFSGLAVLGLLVSAVPATLAEIRYSNAAYRLRNWRSPESRKLNYLEYVLANDEHVKEVKLFALGPVLLGRYREQGEVFFREDRALAVRRASWAFVLSLLATFAFYGCYAVMALSAAAGRLSLGNLTLYVVAFRQGQQAFQSVLAAIGGMYEDNLYMSNLFEYLSINPDGPDGRDHSDGSLTKITNGESKIEAVAAGAPTPSIAEEGIRFEHVGFRYPKSGGGEGQRDGAGKGKSGSNGAANGAAKKSGPATEKWALRDVSLFIPRGQSLALVGQNGAGKTTFIKLLTRLYDPTEGRILLDGKDLRDWDRQALRSRIGVIFQDFNQYQLSLRENVGLGSAAHLADDARIHRATTNGGAEEVVTAFPEGLETHLGRWFQDGVELSGGQWQKVALSRAFMREEADILVLDEPTAALDAEAEHVIFERFRTLARGRTALLISHRFPTVRMADRILVLEGGQVIEEGTHTELLAAGTRYAQLFSLQAQGYQ